MISILYRLRAANSARLFYTLTMAAVALFPKAGHDFMARTVYRLTQKSLLYQAGTRRKLLMDTGASLTGDTVLGLFKQGDKGGAAGLGLGELRLLSEKPGGFFDSIAGKTGTRIHQ